jgi:hypothetical protein
MGVTVIDRTIASKVATATRDEGFQGDSGYRGYRDQRDYPYHRR